MDLNTNELRGGIGLGHLQETVSHTKTYLDDPSAGTTKGRVPIQHSRTCRKPQLRKALFPAALLTRRHAPSAHHKTANPIRG
jgi:hypothetical protein